MTTKEPPKNKTCERNKKVVCVRPVTSVPRWLPLACVPNLIIVYSLLHVQDKSTVDWCALLFAAVAAFRCVFPNRYNKNIVYRDTILSSIFLTRLLATFAEYSWMLTWSPVASKYNSEETRSSWGVEEAQCRLTQTLVDCLPHLCAAAQVFVWTSMILMTDSLMFLEETIWALMGLINTLVNAYLYIQGVQAPGVIISIVFGVLYLPWQLLHLKLILFLDDPWLDLREIGLERIVQGIKRCLFFRRQSEVSEDWGGWIGESWMVVYWTLIPMWMFYMAIEYRY